MTENETSNDEVHEEGPTAEEVTGDVNKDCGLQEHTIVQSCDFNRESDEIKPIDDIGKDKIAKHREV